MKKQLQRVIATACGIVIGINALPQPAWPQDGNPLLAQSTLPYHTLPFDKIKDTDWEPAFDVAMLLDNTRIRQIADNPAPPTFENTVLALEQSSTLLYHLIEAFYFLRDSNDSPVLAKADDAVSPKISERQNNLLLNSKIFARVKAVYDQRKTLRLGEDQSALVEKYYRNFSEAGALLSDVDKERLKAIGRTIDALQSEFDTRVRRAQSSLLGVEDKRELAGLSELEIQQAAKEAKDSGIAEPYALGFENVTQPSAITALENRPIREALFSKSWKRAEGGDDNDTRKVIAQLAEARAEWAAVLGAPNYATVILKHEMVKSPAGVSAFLKSLANPATAKIEYEAEHIQKQIDKSGSHFDLQPWDWSRYAEAYRRERYNIDQQSLKPYLQLDKVLKDGVFYAASSLYGLSFEERSDIPVYHPDVRAFEVKDEAGKGIGLIYLDYFQRDNKNGGAVTHILAWDSGEPHALRAVANTLNIPKPLSGQPALVSFSDVTTMFHEFGHALNFLLCDSRYYSTGLIKTPRDWLEFPSQFNERWAVYPDVLRRYAVHYQTGQPLSPQVVNTMTASQTWGRGYWLGEYLSAAALDLKWHSVKAGEKVGDVDLFEQHALESQGVNYPDVPPRYRSTYFQHIWTSGYGARYYSYIWTVMLADAAYAWFGSHGGLTRENGKRFRNLVLSKGVSEDYASIFRDFYGRDADIAPLYSRLGLQPNGKDAIP